MIFQLHFYLLGNDTCLQNTKNGHCCKLPFVYDGKKYTSCTKDCTVELRCAGWSTTLATAYYWCYYDQENEKYDECKGKQNDEK